MSESSSKPEENEPRWARDLLIAIVGGAIAGAVALLKAELTLIGVVLVTFFGAIAAWATARLFTHPKQRQASSIALVLILFAMGGVAFTTRITNPLPEGVTGFVGGCPAFSLYAQNRWTPLGAAVRAAPSPHAIKVGGYAPNELVPVDGWVRTQAADLSNQAPFDSDVWFHLEDNKGWVSFAGVRATTTEPDPTLRADGGAPAPTDPDCFGSVR